MRLTKRQRYILEELSKNDPEVDLVESSGEVWLGLERTNMRVLNFFLVNVLISMESWCGSKDYRIYHINEWGRRALTDDSFDPQLEMAQLLQVRDGMH